MTDEITRGTLSEREPHPAAIDALSFVLGLGPEKLLNWREAFASCAIEGNRAGDVCGATLDRLLNGQPVSDRYLLGLAWVMNERYNVK